MCGIAHGGEAGCVLVKGWLRLPYIAPCIVPRIVYCYRMRQRTHLARRSLTCFCPALLGEHLLLSHIHLLLRKSLRLYGSLSVRLKLSSKCGVPCVHRTCVCPACVCVHVCMHVCLSLPQFFCQELGYRFGRQYYASGISDFGADEDKP